MCLLPIVVGQVVVFKCPKCGKVETYTVRREDAEEAISFGASKIGFFHRNHIFLCGINSRGEPILRSVEVSNMRTICSNNRVYAKDFLVVCEKDAIGNQKIAVADINKKILDLRCYSDSVNRILSFFSKEIDSILAKYGSLECVITMIHKDFDMIKLNNGIALIKVDRREYSKKELGYIESIFREGLDKIVLLDKNKVDENVRRVYDLFIRYSWYFILLKLVFPKTPDSEMLSKVICFVEKKINMMPRQTDIENIRMLMEAENIIIKPLVKPQTLGMTKPIATLFNLTDITDLVNAILEAHRRDREITLKYLLGIISCEEIDNFIGFLRELEKHRLIELRGR